METRALAGLRVLELGGMVAAPYCAKLMADLGADVIKVEAPGAGDPARRRGPFPDDVPHPERSALFLYLNTSKRGVTLDITKEEGRRLFVQLAEKADLVIEDRQPGELAALGLDYARLSAVNPRLVMVSITPFGQDGPYAHFRTYHLNQYQAGGLWPIRPFSKTSGNTPRNWRPSAGRASSRSWSLSGTGTSRRRS